MFRVYILFVAGSVGDDELAPGGSEIAIRDVDGDALLAFRPEAVRDQREIDTMSAVQGGRCAQGDELILINCVGVVQQPPNKRRLSIIHAARGNESQQIAFPWAGPFGH
jgi:hypothetical protein